MRRFGPAAGGGGVPSNPYWANTVLQLHGEGASIVDSSSSPKSLVIGGSAATSATQAKFGSKSIDLSGGGYVQASGDPSMVIGTGDFTFETWIYPTANGGQEIILDTRHTGMGGGGFVFDTSGGVPRYYDGASFYSSSGSVALNTWSHVEFTRVSGQAYMFVDGVLVLTRADTADYWHDSPIVGGAAYYPIGAAPMHGYLDEVRYIVGEGVHTSGFAPPTAPYPDGP